MYRQTDDGQVARALKILDALRGYKTGRLVSELAAEANASERTVKRDIAALQDAGIEIARDPIDGRAAARLKDRAYSYVAITKRERYTLLAVRRMFDVLKGTPFADDIDSVLHKLEQRMNPEERAEHATLGERFAYIPSGGTKPHLGTDDILDALLSGVLTRKLVRYAYRGARGRAQHGFLAPFAMLLYKQGLYVVGKRLASKTDLGAIDTGEVLNFAAERFSEAEWLRDTSFVPPSDFKLDDFVDDSFGAHVGKDPPQRVVVEFSKERAAYARGRIWHRTQQIEEQSDGTVLLSFTRTCCQSCLGCSNGARTRVSSNRLLSSTRLSTSWIAPGSNISGADRVAVRIGTRIQATSSTPRMPGASSCINKPRKATVGEQDHDDAIGEPRVLAPRFVSLFRDDDITRATSYETNDHSARTPTDLASRRDDLVLGTMPGKASLQAGQYYAHGQNSFWKLAATILGFDPSSSYEKRVSSVVAARVAVWDVLRLCTREGSLDSDIEDPVPNEFIDFFKTHREVDRVCFNGSKAEQLYKTYVLAVITKPLDYRPLPSTSQANASVTFASKLSQWSVGLSRD